MVLASECYGPDGTLDRVSIEFSSVVVEKAAKRRRAREPLADGLDQPTSSHPVLVRPWPGSNTGRGV